jgi:hypothetical protein
LPDLGSVALVPFVTEEAVVDEDPEYDPEEVFPADTSPEGTHFSLTCLCFICVSHAPSFVDLISSFSLRFDCIRRVAAIGGASGGVRSYLCTATVF